MIGREKTGEGSFRHELSASPAFEREDREARSILVVHCEQDAEEVTLATRLLPVKAVDAGLGRASGLAFA
jgi:hypothetical protein